MELMAILKARSLAMIELDSLNIGGKIRLADCIQPLVERFDFKVFPTKPEDFDLTNKGIRFESGKAGGLLVESLTIYDGAIVVDTVSSTDDSKRILLEMLDWGRSKLGLTYHERQIRRWGNISNVVFRSEIPLLRLMSGPLHDLAQKTSAFTEKAYDGLKYEPLQVVIGHDPSARKHGIAGFLITHRVNTSPSENIFFSEAPLPTLLHVQYLEELEKDISGDK